MYNLVALTIVKTSPVPVTKQCFQFIVRLPIGSSFFLFLLSVFPLGLPPFLFSHLQLELGNNPLAIVLVNPQIPLEPFRLDTCQIHLLDPAHLQCELQVLLGIPTLEQVSLLFELQLKLISILFLQLQHPHDLLNHMGSRCTGGGVHTKHTLDFFDFGSGVKEVFEGGFEVGEDD